MTKAKTWKGDAADRRDARNARTPEVDANAKPAKKKNTKRWCRGKVGVEHVLECVKKEYYSCSVFYVHACTTCGKELAWWHPSTRWLPPRDRKKPDWVID